VVDLLQAQESAKDIEQKLNAQFAGEQFTISNYRGEEVDLTVEAIHARPKFSPLKEAHGIAQVEGENLFTQLENERIQPTLKEKLRARIFGKWITFVRLRIAGGDAASIRPAGVSIGHITATTSIRYQGYDDNQRIQAPVSPIRVADTHDLQSDKLEIKIRYDGQIGNYAERIADSINLLQEIQDEMEYYATMYLLELHDSGNTMTDDEFSWPDDEQARNLGKYLFERPIDADQLEYIATKMKASHPSLVKTHTSVV